MDSEFDSLDDFVAPPADEGACKKLKPKAKGRSKPCMHAVPSTSSNALKEKDVNLNPAVVETVMENSTEVTNSGCDADALNNSDEPLLRDLVHQGDSHEVVTFGYGGTKDVLCGELRDESANLQWDPFDDIDLGQSVNIEGQIVENQHGIVNRDASATTSKPDSGRAEPENCGAFNSELLDSPSIFPAADDYFSINAHSVYCSEIGRSGTFVPDDDMHMHGETAHEIPSERADDFAHADDTGTSRSSRVLRKSKTRSAQPSELVESENDGLLGDLLSDSALSQDVRKDNNKEDTDFKRKGVKRSRKYAPGPDSVEQKKSRKKVNDTSSEQNEKPKKKFSHSTKKKKNPDPELLAAIAAPANEFDYKRYPLKVLIGVAKHNECESKKVTTPSNTSATNQRIESRSPWNEVNDYDMYQNGDNYSNQDGGADDENGEVQESSSYFNYHSYRKTTPRGKWSEQDTELFYQGLRQFGSDFSLIEQFFTDKGQTRTRNQIQKKFNNEDRQNPQRITEALINKASVIYSFQQESEELSHYDNGPEVDEDDVQEATTELNDNTSTELEQNDMVAEDDEDAFDTTTEDQHEFQEVDEDEPIGWDTYIPI